ncbi:deoxyuridine 5'-triphosphate nucleotidohydrolase-like [Oppia nitens]|uniref:deoxyuridine 5'-triphosphate nucleotidohydrolase-like n=1 Tax=Oppia nitens TaxID=1686743 RepID=UPI0023DBDA42|nr:deoxyuridine 5'-triphosphate nucleotidohydrolase-like [Oppia nitens]
MAPNVYKIFCHKIGANLVLKCRLNQTEDTIHSVFVNICRQFSRDYTMNTSMKESVSKLRFARLSDNAFVPTRGSERAAGYDLYAAYDAVVPKRGKQMVKTDIQVAIPSGCYGRVAPRSGLAWKNSIDVGAGVVDEDYRGNVCVILFNFGDEDFVITKGDRIAQLICERIAATELIEETTLDTTARQEGGFGSTGVSLAALKSPQKVC